MSMFCACAGLMIGILTAQPEPPPPTPIFSQTGYLSQYVPGLMQLVVDNRIEWDQLPDDPYRFDVHLAVLDCDHIGRIGTLTYEDGLTESVLVTDCSGHATTTAWFRRDNIIGEVDYETAARRGFVGRGGVLATLELFP